MKEQDSQYFMKVSWDHFLIYQFEHVLEAHKNRLIETVLLNTLKNIVLLRNKKFDVLVHT